MTQLWQLTSLSNGAKLSKVQPLPENWGPIFGLSGVVEKLSDLSWLGEAYSDMGWFKVDAAEDGPLKATAQDLAWEKAKQLLRESDWAVLPDVPLTSGEKAAWVAYRAELREIRSQAGFPDVIWPVSPE